MASRAFRRLADGLAHLLSPHLSVSSVDRLDAFTEWFASAETLESFFTLEAVGEDRALLIRLMEEAAQSY